VPDNISLDEVKQKLRDKMQELKKEIDSSTNQPITFPDSTKAWIEGKSDDEDGE